MVTNIVILLFMGVCILHMPSHQQEIPKVSPTPPTSTPPTNVSSEEELLKQRQKAKELQEVWCRFITEVYNILSQYKFQHSYTLYNAANIKEWGIEEKAEGISINRASLLEFTGRLMAHGLDSRFGEYFNTSNVTSNQFDQLNNVLELLLKVKPQIYCQEDKLVIKRNIVTLSDISEFKNCSKLKVIQIFAAEKIYIDKDLDFTGLNIVLAILAPEWEIVDNRRIHLDGVDGDKVLPPRIEGAGKSGEPGNPGGPGGSFFAFGKIFRNSEKLTIVSRGGDGSDGQHGANGKDGGDGRNANVKAEKYHCSKDGITWTCYGEEAETGRDAGIGGAGGLGASRGSVDILSLGDAPRFEFVLEDGKNGTEGKSGRAGKGGKHGDTEEAKHFVTWQTVYKKKNNTRAPDGKVPKGINSRGIKQPKSPIRIEPYRSNIIIDYLFYLEDSLVNDFTRKQNFNLILALFKSKTINGHFTTLDAINSFMGVEQHFYHLHDKMDLLPLYEEIQQQVEIRSNQLTGSKEDIEEGKKVLSHVYTTLQSKICAFHDTSSGKYIANLDRFLDMFMHNSKALKETQEQVAIAKVNQEYKAEIDKKIEEADNLITEGVTPKINGFTKMIDDKIEALMDEIEQKRREMNDQKAELEKQQRDLERALTMGILGSVLQVLGSAVQFLPGVGQVIAAAIAVVNTAIEVAVDTPQAGDLPEKILDLGEAINDFKEKIVCKKSKKEQLEEQYEKIDNEMTNHPNNMTRKAYLLQKNRSAASVSPVTPDPSKSVSSSTNVTSTAATTKVATTKATATKDATTRATAPKTAATKAAVTKAVATKAAATKAVTSKPKKKCNTKKCADDYTINAMEPIAKAVEGFRKAEATKQRLAVVEDALKKSGADMKKLEAFKAGVQTSLVPIIEDFQRSMSKIQDDLKDKSSAQLDFAQMELKEKLDNIKKSIQKFTKDFNVGPEIDEIIDKVLDGINTMINIFKKIQGFEDDKKLADYMTNINSVRYQGIVVRDQAVVDALARLKLNMQSNVMLLDYKNSMNQLKLFVFPFAKTYFEKFSVPSFLEQEPGKTEDFLATAVKDIETYKKKITRDDVYVAKYDKIKHRKSFYSGLASSKPFYVWHNQQHRDSISRLLAGKEEIFMADIEDHIENALKFSFIHLRLKVVVFQGKLDTILKNFTVSMKHMGNNYYKCLNKTYVVITESLEFQYSFENINNKPVTRNLVYEKLNYGDFMLSPFTTWRFRLSNVTPISFDVLKEFRTYADLELVGEGEFFDDDPNLCNDDVDSFYEVHDVTLEKPEPPVICEKPFN